MGADFHANRHDWVNGRVRNFANAPNSSVGVLNVSVNRDFCFVRHWLILHTLDAGLLARSQYPEGPATRHLGTGFSWFPCVCKRMLRWFPRPQVATACCSCSPPDLNFLDPYFIFMYMHVNHCHRAIAHLQLNLLLLLLLLLLYFTIEMESDYRAVRTGSLKRLCSIPRNLVQIQSNLSLSLYIYIYIYMSRAVWYNVTITF